VKDVSEQSKKKSFLNMKITIKVEPDKVTFKSSALKEPIVLGMPTFTKGFRENLEIRQTDPDGVLLKRVLEDGMLRLLRKVEEQEQKKTGLKMW